MASHGDLSPELKKLREKRQHFYLTVYTSTEAIEDGLVCGGGLDLGLNEKGIEDARKLCRRIQKNPIKIKRIISGPELRTIQLADFMHDALKGKILVYREFADQNLGDLEGKPEQPSMNFQEPKNGEHIEDFSIRVHHGLIRLFKENMNCMIVAHPRVAQMIFRWIGIGNEKIEPGVVYSVDLPEGMGIGHFHII